MSKLSKWRRHPIREFSLWSWRRKWNLHKNITAEYNQLLLTTFQDISRTSPLRCEPEAEVELHTLMGHYHLNMYLTAVKSLLRFMDHIAVVAHDGDGDLTEQDRQLLRMHIPGIRLVERCDADRQLQGLLQHYPCCRSFRSNIVNSLELFDHNLLSRGKRIIIMNSDVLFLQRPQELMNWVNHDNNRIVYAHENHPAYQNDFLLETGSSFPPHVTLALACLYPDIMNLNRIEHLLRTSKLLKKHRWPAGQNLYPILFEESRDRYTATTFDPDKFDASGIFHEGAIFRHYWSSVGNTTSIHATDAKRVMSEIGA